MATKQTKNMIKRGPVWYWRQTIRGTRHLESLQTGDVNVARARMKVKRKAAEEGAAGKLYGTRSKNVFPSIGELLEIYLDEVRRRGTPKLQTAMINCGRLRMILDVTGIPAADAATADVLTADRLKKYANTILDAGKGSPSAQRSAASTIRQARSIFSRRMMDAYEHLTLPPSIIRFREAYIVSEPQHRYQLPPSKLIESTVSKGRALRETNEALYMAFILCYDLGLRAEEAAQCRPDWIREDNQGIAWLEIIDRPDENYSPKTPRSIPVPEAIRKDIEEIGGEGSIIPLNTITDRRNLIKRELSAWMRDIGWTRSKCAHELRKLRGSFWRSKYGLDRAHDWLGHSQYQTTLNYYARLPNEPEPLPVDGDLEALRKR